MRRACCLVLWALLGVGCATAPAPREVAAVVADPDTAALSAWVDPSHPFVLAVYPETFRAQRGAVAAVLGEELAPSGEAPVLAWLLFGTLGLPPEAALPPLEGLDEARPTLLGFFSTGPARAEALAPWGGVMDPEEAPTFLHARAVLPCKDVAAASASLRGWAEVMGLGEPEVVGQDRLWEQERMMLLASARGDALRLDLAINVRDREQARAWLRARADAPPAARAMDPAWGHFLEADGAASLYTDMEALARFYVGSGMLEAAAALELAAPEQRDALMGYAMALVLRGARALNAYDRDARATTISAWGEGEVVTLRSTRALSARAVEAAAASRQQAGRTWRAAAEAPLLELRLHQSLRALAEARGLPAWAERPELRELSELVRESGSFLLLYALQNEPLMQWLSLAPDPAWLPDSATVVLEDANLDPQRGLFVSGAVALDYPAQIPDAIPAQLERWKQELEQNIQGIPVQLSVAPDGGYTRVLLGVGRAPAEVLRLDAPARVADRDLSLRADMERLQRLLTPLLFWGQSSPLLPPLRALTLEDFSDARGHASTLQLGARALPALASAPPTLRPAADSPPPVEALSDGRRCLLDASREMSSGLMARQMVSSDQRDAFEEAVEEVVQEGLACALADPAAAPLAREVQARWRLQGARALASRGQDEQAARQAGLACQSGLALACELQRRLTPPWEPAALTEAAARWPVGAPVAQAPVLALTRDAIWFRGARLGARELLDGDAAALREALQGVEAGQQVELRLDRATPQRELLAALSLLRERGLPVVARVRAPEEAAARFLPLSAAGARGDAPRLWLRWTAAGISLRSDREDFGVHAPGDLPALAEVIAAAREPFADAPALHLLIESPELPWEALAPVLGALQLPGASAVTTEIELLQRLRALRGEPPLARAEALLALMEQAREPAQLFLGSGEPEATRRKKLPRAKLTAPSAARLERPNKEGLRRAIASIQPQLRRCYEARLTTDPDAILRFSLGLSIDAQGQARLDQLKGLDDEALAGCLQRAVEQLRFQPPEGGGQVQVSWPMVFHPGQ